MDPWSCLITLTNFDLELHTEGFQSDAHINEGGFDFKVNTEVQLWGSKLISSYTYYGGVKCTHGSNRYDRPP